MNILYSCLTRSILDMNWFDSKILDELLICQCDDLTDQSLSPPGVPCSLVRAGAGRGERFVQLGVSPKS